MYDVRIGRINELATDIYAMTLEPCDGRDAPEITPGMHVNLRMPSGIERSYSLVNAPKMRKHWRSRSNSKPTDVAAHVSCVRCQPERS